MRPNCVLQLMRIQEPSSALFHRFGHRGNAHRKILTWSHCTDLIVSVLWWLLLVFFALSNIVLIFADVCENQCPTVRPYFVLLAINFACDFGNIPILLPLQHMPDQLTNYLLCTLQTLLMCTSCFRFIICSVIQSVEMKILINKLSQRGKPKMVKSNEIFFAYSFEWPFAFEFISNVDHIAHIVTTYTQYQTNTTNAQFAMINGFTFWSWICRKRL